MAMCCKSNIFLIFAVLVLQVVLTHLFKLLSFFPLILVYFVTLTGCSRLFMVTKDYVRKQRKSLFKLHNDSV